MPSVKKLEMSGASKVVFRNYIGSDLDLELSGASSVRGIISLSNTLTVDSSGASEIKLEGTVKNAEVEISGASSIKCLDLLIAQNLDLEASGASNAKLIANGRIKAKLSGASSFKYGGGCQKHKNQFFWSIKVEGVVNFFQIHKRNVIYIVILCNLTKPTMTNIPISKSDPFTKKFNLEWESLSGNNFYEKVLNGTINMVSTKPNINRLFLTANNLDGKDYLILRHPNKDYMLDIGDKFYILFENNEVLEFDIEKKSYHLYNNLSDIYKQVYENRILLYKEDLENLSQNLIKDWRILTSGNRKIEGMRPFGGKHHEYNNKESLQIALKSLFIDYNKIVGAIENYEPLSKLDFKDEISLTEVCHLYLMKDLANGYYKIGISNNPEYREKTLQSEKPTIELITSKGFTKRKIALAMTILKKKTFAKKKPIQCMGFWVYKSKCYCCKRSAISLYSLALASLPVAEKILDRVFAA